VPLFNYMLNHLSTSLSIIRRASSSMWKQKHEIRLS
jgi:hypothetical protein